MGTATRKTRWAIGYVVGATLWVLLFSTSEVYAQTQVGQVLFAKGAATASREDSVRLMGNGTPVYQKDLLTTGQRSMAIIELNDGTRMTIRPNSVFRVDQFTQKSGSESVLLSMFKGGLRAITGLISKRNSDAFILHTPVATIGIRGTDFSARICADDCLTEADRVADETGEASLPTVNAVARLAFAKGVLSATSIDGKQRVVHLGGAIYEGDTLLTGNDAFAVLTFHDESRITLQANTHFQIERHTYTEKKSDETGALMHLFQGGIRAVSGLISKVRPASYKVETPVGTLSTRGTSFDVLCPTADCFVETRSGLLSYESDGKIIELPPKSVAFFRQNTTVPRFDIPIPATLLQNLGPRPEEIRVDPKLFETVNRPPDAGTLNVAVYDKGQVDVTLNNGTRLSLGEGESAQAGSDELFRLEGGVPKFVSTDTYNISPDIDVEGGALPLNKLDSGGPNSQECTF
ncbi:MAG: hypothetical protein GY815_11415 [Gammaproteobacteria bacterium]|nr:hypothetical protein [Gammaproteobacteria bacterium]